MHCRSRAAPDPKCGGSPASRSINNPHPRNPPTPHQHSPNGNSQPPFPRTTQRGGLASGLFALSARAWGEEAVNNKHTHPHRHFTIPPYDFPSERVLPFPISLQSCFLLPHPIIFIIFLYLWLRMTRRRHRAQPSSVVSESDDSHGAPHPLPPHPLGHLRPGVLSFFFIVCVCVLHGPVAWFGIFWVGFSVGGRSVGKITFIIIIGQGEKNIQCTLTHVIIIVISIGVFLFFHVWDCFGRRERGGYPQTPRGLFGFLDLASRQ